MTSHHHSQPGNAIELADRIEASAGLSITETVFDQENLHVAYYQRENDLDDGDRAIIVAALRATHKQSGVQSEPVAWRYKCHDGQIVFMETRLTDEQKARGYYRDEDDDDFDDDDGYGPFKWSDETPLYAASTLSSADRRMENAPKCGFCGRAVFGPCMSKAQAAGCELPPELSSTESR